MAEGIDAPGAISQGSGARFANNNARSFSREEPPHQTILARRAIRLVGGPENVLSSESD
jgi:hypothetical protein